MQKGIITWDSGAGSQEKALAQYSETIKSCTGIYKGNSAGTYHASADFRTIRPDFNRSDYDSYRENSAVPDDKRKSLKMCLRAYKNVGIIRNIIDLMGDFACQGINLIHRDKSVESFYQQWFKKVEGKERSERFLNNLYRSGNVVMYRSYADISPGLLKYMKSVANDVKIEEDIAKNEIPLRYNFFNPLSLDVKEDGKLYLNVTSGGKFAFNSGWSSSYEMKSIPKPVFDTLPSTLQEQIRKNKGQIPLEEDRLLIFHYKKDDWEQWADPLIHAILDDIILLEKMRLADLSALDGAISNIRLWTLGDLEHHILPTQEGVDRLRDILASNQGGGTMELVWGPELKFTESATQVHKFLGGAKYDSVLSAIYGGMGVPPTLTGLAGNGGGFTNNFISLKTLVERLQYGRDLLVKFWEKELELVRKAMGFRYSPEVRFDQMTLSDENAEKLLLIQLADRDIISHETLLERFKESPKVEKNRLLKEVEERKEEGTPEKAGPFHNANNPQELEKMDVQHKQSLEMTDKQQQYEREMTEKQMKEDSKNNKLKMQNEIRKARVKTASKPKSSKKPVRPNGRPKGANDKSPRKQRIAKPRSKASISEVISWVNNSWESISKMLNEGYLKTSEKTNLRQLSKAQVQELESLKVDVLTNLEPLESIDNSLVYEILSSGYRPCYEFQEMIKDAEISTENMSIDLYRNKVTALYVEYLMS
jgi:hypothetical protein